jgi:hypothetical protein
MPEEQGPELQVSWSLPADEEKWSSFVQWAEQWATEEKYKLQSEDGSAIQYHLGPIVFIKEGEKSSRIVWFFALKRKGQPFRFQMKVKNRPSIEPDDDLVAFNQKLDYVQGLQKAVSFFEQTIVQCEYRLNFVVNAREQKAKHLHQTPAQETSFSGISSQVQQISIGLSFKAGMLGIAEVHLDFEEYDNVYYVEIFAKDAFLVPEIEQFLRGETDLEKKIKALIEKELFVKVPNENT